jgi:hypothetical protein
MTVYSKHSYEDQDERRILKAARKQQYIMFLNNELKAELVKLLPLPHPPVRARTDTRTNPSAQRATQLRSVLARVYAVSRENQITVTVP